MPEDASGDAARHAEEAWRSAAPEGAGPQAILRHGRRVARRVAGAPGADPAALRALTAAALLHEVGRFLPGRGHYAARGARWAAVRMDDILPGASDAERRLVGELILFHRHRGPLPPEISRPELVDAFRRAESDDLAGGGDPQAPRGPLGAALRRSDLAERLRHPLVARRVTRIRRPDR